MSNYRRDFRDFQRDYYWSAPRVFFMAVEIGIVEFEAEFFGNIVMPGTNCTLAEVARDSLAVAYEKNAFTPLLPAPGGTP